MLLDSVQVLSTIFGQTYELMNCCTIPGTNVTPWGFFMWFVRLSIIFFALKTLLGWEIGIARSKYTSWRTTPSPKAKSSGGGFNHKGLPPSSKNFTRR